MAGRDLLAGVVAEDAAGSFGWRAEAWEGLEADGSVASGRSADMFRHEDDADGRWQQ